jgi:hypothetical protein
MEEEKMILHRTNVSIGFPLCGNAHIKTVCLATVSWMISALQQCSYYCESLIGAAGVYFINYLFILFSLLAMCILDVSTCF